MSTFAILALFAQACLVQSVLSQQCGCGQISYGSYGSYAPPPLNLGTASLNLPCSSVNIGNIGIPSQGNSLLNAVSSASHGSYGGTGCGQVAVVGDIGVGGNTVVVGSVPVLGAVDFNGIVPASGSVSISGQCGCSCH